MFRPLPFASLPEANAEVPVTRYVYDRRQSTFTQRSTHRFIRGPIPFDWMKKANRLPGKAGIVGMALWFLRGVKLSPTFTLTREFDELTGCQRKAIYAALKALESAQLIRVVRRDGGRPEITLLTTG